MQKNIRIALVSGSLNPESLSRQMALHAATSLDSLGANVDFIDLQQVKLPLCDGDTAYSDPEVEKTRSRLTSAAGRFSRMKRAHWALACGCESTTSIRSRGIAP